MRFRDLRVMDRFLFKSETEELPMSVAIRGPWIKVSARKYCHESKPGWLHAIQVGTINTAVILKKEN